MNIKKYAASILMAAALMAPMAAFAGWPAQQVQLSLNATNGGVIVAFTTPIAPAGTTLTNLDVRYDTSPISTLNWSSHPQVMWWTNPGTPGTVQNAVVTGLNTNTYYYFAVKVQNSAGSWSTMSASTPSVVLTGGAGYNVGLAWTPSISTNVAGYKIYYGTASGVYSNTISLGNVTSCIVSNQAWGVMYYYAATAVDVMGVESQFSNETSYQRP
jgi:hypothetical protein